MSDTEAWRIFTSFRENVTQRDNGRSVFDREREDGGDRRSPQIPRMHPLFKRVTRSSHSLSFSLSLSSSLAEEEALSEEEEEERRTSQECPGPDDCILLRSKIRFIFSISSLDIPMRDGEGAGECGHIGSGG